MKYLYIGMTEPTDELENMINDIVTDLKTKNIYVKIRSRCSNNVNVLEIELEAENQLNYLKIYLANVLSQYIINKYEQKFISRIINSNYCYFNSQERRKILSTAIKKIVGFEEKNIFSNLFKLRRKNIIVKKLIEYLEVSNEIILDGFVTFRLKEYMKELEDVVDKAVDDYLMEKEYEEFIRLLKYFVDIQEPKFEIVHVLSGYNNRYILLDHEQNEITNECIQDFVNEVAEGEINYDDLLVSSLITLAPKKIYIHMSEQIQNKQLLETIKSVFYGKVVFCSGCDLCMVNRLHFKDVSEYVHH
jgi:putative sporulation protein YtxC